MPAKGNPLPSTLERSPKKAQDTYEQTLESAERTYDGDEERAHRTAWSAVKHSFESYGGVDVEGKTKDELLEEARKLGAHVTTHMRKDEIAHEIQHANERATRAAREGR